jgi:hypothetical protein
MKHGTMNVKTVKSILCIFKINRDHEDGIVQIVHPEYVEDSWVT